VGEQLVLIYTNYYIYINFYLCLYYDIYTHKQTKQYFIELYRSISNTHLFTLTTTTSTNMFRGFVNGSELNTKHRRLLMRQLDPYRGTNVRRPSDWNTTQNAKLVSLIDTYDITRLEFRRLYRQLYPEGLPLEDSNVHAPTSTLSSSSNAVSHEGKNTLEIEVRVERGESNDEPGGAAGLPSVPIEGANSDNCINISDSEEDEGDHQDDPFGNAVPFDNRRICRDNTLEPTWFPNIAQVQINQAFPTADSEVYPLNPSWHPLALQWGPRPAVVPPYYPYSEKLHRQCRRSRFPKCGFYHVLWNNVHDLSGRWVDLPCGCRTIHKHNPWLGASWIKNFFPVLFARMVDLQQRHLNHRALAFYPDCFVVEIPDGFTDAASECVEIWPIRSRFEMPLIETVATTPRRKRRSQPHSSKRQLLHGRKRRANEAVNFMITHWYDNCVPESTYTTLSSHNINNSQ
jgi:hypothetical protein